MTGPLLSISCRIHRKIWHDLQIRATNTNVDDGADLLAGVTLPLAAADLLGELLHVVQDFVDILDDTLAIDLHWLVGGIAEGNMVDSAVLGEVDLVASEHVITELLEARLFCELDKKLQGLLGNEVLGEVEQDLRVLCIVLKGAAKLFESLRHVSITWVRILRRCLT
jgi:hypothetical protein